MGQALMHYCTLKRSCIQSDSPGRGCLHMSLNRLWSSGNLGPEPDVAEDKEEAWLDNQGMSFMQQAT